MYCSICCLWIIFSYSFACISCIVTLQKLYHNRRHYHFSKKKVRITKRAWLWYLHQFIIEVVEYSLNYRSKTLHLLGVYGLKQGGQTCCDTRPRFLRSQPKDSLDPHVHRPLTLLSLWSQSKQGGHTFDRGPRFLRSQRRTALIHMYTGPWRY